MAVFVLKTSFCTLTAPRGVKYKTMSICPVGFR